MCKCTPGIRTPYCGKFGCRPEDDKKETPKLKIFNRDGSVTEVEPIKPWQPCIDDGTGVCKICGEKMNTE